MFRGRHQHSIDVKGRVSIPSKFRDVLSTKGRPTIMVTNDLDPCLAAFPMDEWVEEEKKIKALPSFVPEALQYKRFYLSGAQECPIDRQGRILIPQSLREYAQLDGNVLFVGMLEKFEIWSPELWAPQPENVEQMRKVLQEYL